MKMNILKRVKNVDLSVQKPFLTPTKKKSSSTFDICLKWAPLVAVFALDALENRSKDKLEKHLIDTITGILILNAAVFPLKKVVNRARPNGESKSFPSRHTAISFLGSEIL